MWSVSFRVAVAVRSSFTRGARPGPLGFPQHGDLDGVWHRLFQELCPFAGQPILGPERHSGDVSTGMSQARYDTGSHRIGYAPKHHRHHARDLFRGVNTGGRRHDEHIHLEPNQVGNQLGETLGPSIRPSVLDEDGLPLDVPQVAEPLSEGVEKVLIRRT